MLWVTKAGLRGSSIKAASRSAMPRRRSAAGQERDAAIGGEPAAVEAAVTFLRTTGGNRNGVDVPSDMAGVAQRDDVGEWFRYPVRKRNQQLTRHPPSQPCP